MENQSILFQVRLVCCALLFKSIKTDSFIWSILTPNLPLPEKFSLRLSSATSVQTL